MTADYRRPWVYPKQRAAIFHTARYGIIEASTKSGKTAGCMIWLTEQAMQGRPGWVYWWIAPTYAQAKIVYRRLKRALPHTLYTANESELSLTLGNGAVMAFKTGEKPDALYGDDVHAAVMDEATRQREDAWHAVRSTLTATEGPIRIIGNVKGRRNWAYQLARKAEAGEPGMHYAKITAHDAVEAGIITADEVADAQRQLPDAIFRELYLAEPSDDGGNPFGLEAIRACIGPLSDAPPVAWGWDLAKSVDWTCGIALDASGYVCRVERYQRSWDDTIRDIAQRVQAPALIDSTGVGDPVVEQLQRTRPHTFHGFKFTSTSKQQLMEGLAVAIQRGFVRYPAGVIVSELESYEYTYSRTGVRYTAPEGLHDDAVCALALAVAQHAQVTRRAGFALVGDDAAVPEATRLVAAEWAVAEAIARDGIYWPTGATP